MVNETSGCVILISSGILICGPDLKIIVEEGSGKLGLEQLSLEVAGYRFRRIYIHNVLWRQHR